MSRRVVLSAWTAFAALAACSRVSEPAGSTGVDLSHASSAALPSAATIPKTPKPPIGATLAGFHYVEHLTGGAKTEDALPIVIGLHGHGDRAENYVGVFDTLKSRTRVLSVYGPEPDEDGFSWYDVGDRSDEKHGAGARSVEPRVAAFIVAAKRDLHGVGRPIVTGFSQGAIVAHAVAVMNPELIEVAIPVAGFLPPGVEPSKWPAGIHEPEIFAFHGDKDSRISIDKDEAGIARLGKLGLHARLVRFPGIDHAMGTEELAAYLDLIDSTSRRLAH